jgi:3-oxoacyl-[acyl-carrier protein] reductase
MTKLQGKVALVTGASKGIGAGIAKSLAAEGAAVVVNYASSKEDADRVIDQIIKRNGRAIALQGDVSKASDLDRIFTEATKAFGQLDILGPIAVFLASDDSRWLTGETLLASGGLR